MRQFWDWLRDRADAAAYVRFLDRFKWPVIAAAILIPAALAVPAGGLKLTSDYRVYLGPDNPELKVFEAFERLYTSPDMIFIGVAPETGDVFQPRTLALLRELTEQSWQIPHTIRVDSPINFQAIDAEGDELIVHSLIPNMLPVIVTFGAWGLIVGQIGMIASAVTAATLGLVVDDTVHVLTKYHRARGPLPQRP